MVEVAPYMSNIVKHLQISLKVNIIQFCSLGASSDVDLDEINVWMTHKFTTTDYSTSKYFDEINVWMTDKITTTD